MLTIDEIKQQATHAFSYECQIDLARFLVAANEWSCKLRLVAVAVETDDAMPGWYFHTVFIDTDASSAEIRRLMQLITDSHVMRQTLAPANEYTGERDWSVN